MDLIREKPSFDGILDSQTFNNINKIVKVDNFKTKFGPKPTIWITYDENRTFPIMFPTNDKRDKALAAIEAATSPVVILDFNEYFTNSILKAAYVEKNLPKNKYRLSVHLGQCIRYIMKRENVALDIIATRDAFKNFTMFQLDLLRRTYNEQNNGIIEISESQLAPQCWSKCLYTPKSILKKGITPLQFITQLINNEEHIVYNRGLASFGKL